MNEVIRKVDALDVGLFSFVETQSIDWDQRALLALHSAVAAANSPFAYLEIGSYLGGSLQAVMRDLRCEHVMSIDPRRGATPDARFETYVYQGNTTARMVELLGTVPHADLRKLTTFEDDTKSLSIGDLPARPHYCFIDGEHTHDAVVRDARFCAEAIEGEGIIAFHDYGVIGSAIAAFIREAWRDISFAFPFTGPPDPTSGGGVFVLEMGTRGLLKTPVVERAIASRWHSLAWTIVNRPRRQALPLLLACAAVPAVDAAVAQFRRGFQQYVKSSRPK